MSRSLIHELVMEQGGAGYTRSVVMPAESRSFKATPLRKIAKDAGIDDNDPLLVWALEAQEKAGTNPGSWPEMEAAVYAFIEGHFEIKKVGARNAEEDPANKGPRLLHPDCFHARARKAGIDEKDPALLRAVKALKKWRSGKKWRSRTTILTKMNAAFQELNAALDAFMEAHKNK